MAAAASGPILKSVDSGEHWTQVHDGYSASCIASTLDGSELFALGGTAVSTSKDSGTNWTVTYTPYGYWASVASVDDGRFLIAAARQAILGGPGSVYTSTDHGLTWLPTNVPDDYWNSAASSADGTSLVAAAYGDQLGGSIYISQTVPKPVLSIKSKGDLLLLSWLVPSMKFVLQMNSDLSTTNWVSLTNVPTLNMTNLQNEVVLPPSSNKSFFRLISQ